MRLFLLLSVYLFCFMASAYGQAPGIEWQRCFGGHNADYPRKIEATSDGGYIIVGSTEGGTGGDVAGYHGNVIIGDCWVIKISSTGILQWQRCLGGDYFDEGEDIRQLPDGGYTVLLSSASDNCLYTGNHGGLDYRLVKLDAKGNIEWQKSYGGSKNEYAYSMGITKDGGYIIAGFTESDNRDVTLNHGDRDFWVIKTDGAGNLQWQKSYGGSAREEAWAVCIARDGSYIVAGLTESNDGDVSGNHGIQDGWVIKLDVNGNLRWQQCIGGSGRFDELRSLQAMADGGCIAAGSTSSNDGNVSGKHAPMYESTDFLLVKLNSSGVIEWQKCYGSDANEGCFFVQLTPDGGYIMTGYNELAGGDVSCTADNSNDIWVVKVNGAGQLQWEKSIGGNYFDDGFCVQPLPDGGYILCGSTCSTNVNVSDYHTIEGSTCGEFWIIKLAAAPAIASVVINIPDAVCDGLINTLTASAFNCHINPSYQWRRNGENVGSNSSIYTASDFRNNDIITCEVSAQGTCDATALSASDTKTIKINTAIIHPAITIAADNTTACDCTPVTLKAAITNGGAAPLYKWKVNDVYTGFTDKTYVHYNPQPNDRITCTYLDSAACMDNGYLTSDVIVLQNSGSLQPQVTITASANNICTGTSVTFTAQALNAGVQPSYTWKLNGTVVSGNGNSYITAGLVNGDVINCTINSDPSYKCIAATAVVSNSITTTVLSKADPSVAISADYTTICTGSPVTFTATATNAGANPAYQWRVNSAGAGNNANSFTTAGLTNGDVVSCLLKVDPVFGCATAATALSNQVIITVTKAKDAAVTVVPSASEVCAGQTIVFTATVQNAGTAPSYQWLINNNTVNSNGAVFKTGQLADGDRIICNVTPRSDACSQLMVASVPVVITVKDTPVIRVAPVDTFVRTGTQLQLTAFVAAPGYTFQWSPAGLLDNPLSLMPITRPVNDDVVYTLRATGSNGCITGKTITVRIFTSLIMPGAFTPNNDGYNDVFRIPPHVSLTLSEFAVYNRWGRKIFTTHHINEGWTGTINGLPAETGVYIYTITGKSEKGMILTRGSFVLVR